MAYVCLLKGARVCPEHTWLQMFWSTTRIQLPPKDLCKGPAREMDMKLVFQANSILQAQLRLLPSSHKAWLQRQLGWGPRPKKTQQVLGPNVAPLLSTSGRVFCPGARGLLDGRAVVVASHALMLWGLLASPHQGPSSSPSALLPGNAIVHENPNTL